MKSLNFIEAYKSHETIKYQVADIMERYPQARNSDKYLIYKILTEYYQVKHISDILKDDVPSTETIRRARQVLQAQGYYPSNKSVEKARENLEQIEHEIAHFMR